MKYLTGLCLACQWLSHLACNLASKDELTIMAQDGLTLLAQPKDEESSSSLLQMCVLILVNSKYLGPLINDSNLTSSERIEAVICETRKTTDSYK